MRSHMNRVLVTLMKACPVSAVAFRRDNFPSRKLLCQELHATSANERVDYGSRRPYLYSFCSVFPFNTSDRNRTRGIIFSCLPSTSLTRMWIEMGLVDSPLSFRRRESLSPSSQGSCRPRTSESFSPISGGLFRPF
jgi:hypothetical protein